MDVVKGMSLKGWTVASLVANQVIIVTGAIVRVTGSGLGCPTWPQCTADSYTPHPELGIHGAIEFGNRLLTFVLAAIAVVTFVLAVRAARRGAADRRLARLALAAGLGIPLQAVVGGLSVLARLNPWVVGLHMVLSVALVALCVKMIHVAWDVPLVTDAHRGGVLAVRIVTLLGVVVLAAGVVTTGAGPNSGDGAATRNGLPLELTAKTHAWAAWALVAATVWALVALRRTTARRAVVLLLVVEILQGIVGYVQYATHLPLEIVITHMLGTALFSAALANLAFRVVRSGKQRVDGGGGEDERQIGVRKVEQAHRP
ncbi:COX15/CtaA family protein [Propionicicella superfundia]|uniref:COX15/CtaA family protein n=1 Tax=Propionicicella superfundia TaxID=348582 RepID=UPI001FE060D8|nr:COX15/CtaA family protein [Propionicicella superfundia]